MKKYSKIPQRMEKEIFICCGITVLITKGVDFKGLKGLLL